MRVDRLTIENFTVFNEADFQFSPGLNVLIGANGTGKSHVLKLVYSVTRPIAVVGTAAQPDPNSDLRQAICFSNLRVLAETLRPQPRQSPLSSLIRHGRSRAGVSARGDFGTATWAFGGVEASADLSEDFAPPQGFVVFIPAAEVLSIYPGFVAAFERRELSFDVTVRDLCVDLSANPLRAVSSPAMAGLLDELDKAVGGKAELRGDRFYVPVSNGTSLAAPLLAEGLRKLATIAHLIRNGSLAENGILLWDEPETNMNPKLIPVVARTLLSLAAAGMQVIIATHDFLLSNELSLAAEYQTSAAAAAKIRFFCLSRDDSPGPVRVSAGATLTDIPDNPILQEFAAHYDRERNYFYSQGSAQVPEPK